MVCKKRKEDWNRLHLGLEMDSASQLSASGAESSANTGKQNQKQNQNRNQNQKQNQKQIQMTIWWWDEQACLFTTVGLHSRELEIVLLEFDKHWYINSFIIVMIQMVTFRNKNETSQLSATIAESWTFLLLTFIPFSHCNNIGLKIIINPRYNVIAISNPNTDN